MQAELANESVTTVAARFEQYVATGIAGASQRASMNANDCNVVPSVKLANGKRCFDKATSSKAGQKRSAAQPDARAKMRRLTAMFTAAESQQAATAAISPSESSAPIDHVATGIPSGSAIQRRCIAKDHAQAAQPGFEEPCSFAAPSLAATAAQACRNLRVP